MLKEIITEDVETCIECGSKIPKGSLCYVNEIGFGVCPSCVAEELGNE